MRHWLPDPVVVVHNFPVQFLEGNSPEKVVVAAPNIQDQLAFESLATIKVERRPRVGLWLFFLSLFLLFFLSVF
jgi:hypothetical protein